MNLCFGLDLGQARDYSALVVTERVHQVANPRPPGETFEDDEPTWQDAYHVRHTQRWRLGTPYPSVIAEVVELLQRPELAEALLVFDRSGVGGAVADLIDREWREGRLGGLDGTHLPVGLTFTAGFAPRRGAEGFLDSKTAHKGDVIRRMVTMLNTGRLLLPPGLPGGEQLEKELRAYTVKQDKRTGYVYTEAKHESDHDDLVVALALSVWIKNFYGPEPRYVTRDGSLCEKPEGERVYTAAT